MAVVVGGILVLRLHAFVALLLGALLVTLLTTNEALEAYALAQGMSATEAQALAETTLAERIARGFGRTTGQIGIVIAMASIIGGCLLESGAADRIVRAVIRLFGERRAPQALVGSSFLLAIPVFFDTVFYLMVPLAKSLRLRTGGDYLLYILAIVAGGTMAHSLVPPTPGPLFMAAELGIDLGLMIVGGCIVGGIASTAGFLFARWAARRWELPLRESEASLQALEALARRDVAQLPSVFASLLPVLLPVVLIAASTALESAGTGAAEGGVRAVLLTLGEKNMALILGAAIALLILLRQTSRTQMVEAVSKALMSAGVIILIIGAGGAFGQALQQTGIGQTIQEMSTAYQVAILPLAFVLTALVRTAQGSATVSMITSAGAFAGLASAPGLGFHPLYLALVIGCGSKLVWWMNDSGFWIISQMSGMTEQEGLKTLTPTLAVMGLAGFVAALLGAVLFPLT